MSMLRYHQFSRPVPLEPTEGRRLSLSGELHTLGYYSTVVCLGNPGRPYDLIVDTGSSITAVPCAGCRQCGTHLCGTNGRFSEKASPTAQPVVCPMRSAVTGLSCETCNNRRCEYSVRYTEGSSIRGHILNDFAHFKGTSATASSTKARVYFGCQTQETGMFHKQQADGIIGLQKSHTRSKVPSVLSSLVREKQSRNAFSLCLSSSSGMLLLGGAMRAWPDPLAPAAERVLRVPMERGARAAYTLRVVEARVARAGAASFNKLNLAPGVFHPTIVDSGTTFMYASTPVWRALIDLVLKSLPAGTFTKVGAKNCASLTEAQVASLPLVQLAFGFNGGKGGLTLKPHHYMVEFPRLGMRLRRGASNVSPRASSLFASPPRANASAGTRSYCVGIFDNQRGGTVIGAALMRQREVLFDLEQSTISFLEADCTAITPGTSALAGGFAFDSCHDSKRDGADGANASRLAGGRPTRKLLSPVKRGGGGSPHARGAQRRTNARPVRDAGACPGPPGSCGKNTARAMRRDSLAARLREKHRPVGPRPAI